MKSIKYTRLLLLLLAACCLLFNSWTCNPRRVNQPDLVQTFYTQTSPIHLPHPYLFALPSSISGIIIDQTGKQVTGPSPVQVTVTDGNGAQWANSPMTVITGSYSISIPASPVMPIVISAVSVTGDSVFSATLSALASTSGNTMQEEILFESATYQPSVEIALVTPDNAPTALPYTGTLIIGTKQFTANSSGGRLRFTNLTSGKYIFTCKQAGKTAYDVNNAAINIPAIAVSLGLDNVFSTTFTVAE
jgi:hypothetical protein